MADLKQAGVALAKRMIAFIDASPTPYHAVQNLAEQLREDGFRPLDERDVWTLEPGDRRFTIREGGTLIAFVVGRRSPAEAGFRVIGAHTDSPNLRVKPRGAIVKKGYLQLGVETYGGVLLSTWLDRDLSLAGRVTYDKGGELEHALVDLRRPVARVANLAIHLDRKVNEGLTLNKQRHMVPMIGLGRQAFDLNAELAAQLKIDPSQILASDLSIYDTQRGAIGGVDDEFVFSARLDNLASCFAATEAICGVEGQSDATAVMALYDHEEVGSRSATGAQSNVLAETLERIALAYPEGQLQAFARAIAGSLLVSADMAHAIHPNHSDKHDPEHAPELNRGVVIKSNVNQSYATTSSTAGSFTRFCREAGFEPQAFVVRSDMPCGSTIGPITAARLGIRTVDVGGPMLSMHSCREMAGTLDVVLAVRAYEQLFR
ncbi:MAG: M18 family aminopeptidase [Myxococcales bacterium]|nr:M18 family aminopeptidase [Myxococcales bacterium]